MSSRSPYRRLRQRLDGSDHVRTLPVIALAVLAVVVVTAALATQPTASSSGPVQAETVASVDAEPLPVAVIGDSANLASIRLHEKLGFARIGVQPAVGFKLGRWVDSVLMQRALGPGAQSLPAARPGPAASDSSG